MIMLPLLITLETKRKELFVKEGDSSQDRVEFDLFSLHFVRSTYQRFLARYKVMI